MNPFKDSVLLRLEVPYLHMNFPLAYFPSKAKVYRISPIATDYSRILQRRKESIRDRGEESCHCLSMVGLAGSNLMRESEPLEFVRAMNHFSMDNDPEKTSARPVRKGFVSRQTEDPIGRFLDASLCVRA